MSDIINLIPYGKSNAISRKILCRMAGKSDRHVRQDIEDARREGCIIINRQDGKGYYRTDDINEIERQYYQNRSRALSILIQQKHLRKRLVEAGRHPL